MVKLRHSPYIFVVQLIEWGRYDSTMRCDVSRTHLPRCLPSLL